MTEAGTRRAEPRSPRDVTGKTAFVTGGGPQDRLRPCARAVQAGMSVVVRGIVDDTPPGLEASLEQSDPRRAGMRRMVLADAVYAPVLATTTGARS